MDLFEMMLKGSIVHLSIPQSPSRLLMDLNMGWYVHDFLCSYPRAGGACRARD